MDNLLLKCAGVIFLLSLAVMMVRMFFARGSKLKTLAYLMVYAVVLLGFSRIININYLINPDPSAEELQAVELQAVEFQDYLAGSKHSYTLGVQALESRDYLQAIELLSEVIPGDPNYKDAQAKLAQAEQFYAEQLVEQGRKTMLAGDFDQAVHLFDQSLTYNPDLVEARELKLEALARKQTFLQAQAAQKIAQDLKRGKQQMGQYEFGTDKLGFSVRKTKVTEVIATDLGFSYTSRGDERFLWVYISVANQGKSAVEVSPENFYISGADGSRIARSEATFSQAHLPVKTIKPGSTAEGWVIFYIARQKQFTLHYYGDGYIIDKAIVL